MTRSWYRFAYLDNAPLAKMPVGDEPADTVSSCISLPATPPDAIAVHGHVSAGKGSAAYNAHSYPTKVPPEGIEPFIDYFTRPGDVVLDPFCGSGMTGLAAARTGRAVILNDLSSL